MMILGTAPGISSTSRVASSPPTCGIRMSISTTSGRVRATTSTIPAPSAAVPTTSIPSCAPSSASNPPRIIDWSSTISTRTAAGGVSMATPYPCPENGGSHVPRP